MNGLTENYNPSNLVFTEEEILKLFPEFKAVKSTRLMSVLNTWCVYGIGNNNIEEFNKLASEIVKDSVFSTLLFIHDTEIDPSWNATDNVIYKSYNEFLVGIKNLIDETALLVMSEMNVNPEFEEKRNSLPQLTPVGSTSDKRIIFAYNPDDQTKNFYNAEEFYKFSQKVYEYLVKNKQSKEPFTIYSDKKAMIIIESNKVKTFLNTLLNQFQSKEDYEICTNISKIIKDWVNGGVTKTQKLRGRPRKTKPLNDTKNEQ